MKLCRFTLPEDPEQPRSGFLHELQIYETNGKDAQGIYSLSTVNLLTPLINPPAIKLVEQTGDHVWYQLLNPMGIMPTESQFHIPSHVHHLGIEVRPAVVINAAGEFIELDEAYTFILGFVLIVNFVALDLIEKEKTLGITSTSAKDFDFILGPLLVTPDELTNLQTTLEHLHQYQWSGNIKVNEESVQKIDTVQKINFAECIKKSAETQGLSKAEIVCCSAINQPLNCSLKPGDKITVQVNGIGGIQVSLV